MILTILSTGQVYLRDGACYSAEMVTELGEKSFEVLWSWRSVIFCPTTVEIDLWDCTMVSACSNQVEKIVRSRLISAGFSRMIPASKPTSKPRGSKFAEKMSAFLGVIINFAC